MNACLTSLRIFSVAAATVVPGRNTALGDSIRRPTVSGGKVRLSDHCVASSGGSWSRIARRRSSSKPDRMSIAAAMRTVCSVCATSALPSGESSSTDSRVALRDTASASCWLEPREGGVVSVIGEHPS